MGCPTTEEVEATEMAVDTPVAEATHPATATLSPLPRVAIVTRIGSLTVYIESEQKDRIKREADDRDVLLLDMWPT